MLSVRGSDKYIFTGKHWWRIFRPGPGKIISIRRREIIDDCSDNKIFNAKYGKRNPWYLYGSREHIMWFLMESRMPIMMTHEKFTVACLHYHVNGNYYGRILNGFVFHRVVCYLSKHPYY